MNDCQMRLWCVAAVLATTAMMTAFVIRIVFWMWEPMGG